MNFTDEDLKRLKELMPKHDKMRIEFTDLGGWYKFDFQSLLARLEAAESVILEASEHCPVCGDDVGSMSWKEAMNAWRKAAGK